MNGGVSLGDLGESNKVVSRVFLSSLGLSFMGNWIESELNCIKVELSNFAYMG